MFVSSCLHTGAHLRRVPVAVCLRVGFAGNDVQRRGDEKGWLLIARFIAFLVITQNDYRFHSQKQLSSGREAVFIFCSGLVVQAVNFYLRRAIPRKVEDHEPH